MKRGIFIYFIFVFFAFGENFTELSGDIKYWKGSIGKAIVPPKVSFSDDCVVGKNSIKAEAVDKGDYQGITLNLPEPVDLKDFEGIMFYIKQGYYKGREAGCVFRIDYKDWFIYTDFNSGYGDWTKVFIPFDKTRWRGLSNREVNFEKAISFTWYPYSAMNEPGKFIMIDGLELVSKKDTSGKININKYRYFSQIPEKDKKAEILTDGKIDKENQIVFPAYSENPDISFDLGGVYKIEKIKVEAIAVPSHNISNIIIFTSFDGEKWQQVGNILNESSETEEKHQIIEGVNFEVVGRFLRLKFDRLRSDFPIYIGEISFYGHLATEEEMKKFALITYSIGPSLPELSSKDYYLLKEGDTEVWIERNKGVIGGIFKGKNKIVERVFNTYIIAERGKREKSDGYKDEVIESKTGKNSVKLKIINKDVPFIEIEKEYILKDKRLEQKISFKNKVSREYFLYNITEVILPKEYRQNGVYESWGGGHKLERRFAEDIVSDLPAEYAPCLSFENFKNKEVLFYYRYMKDENYTPLSYSVGGFGCLEKYSLVFTPNGWRVGDGTFKMEKDGIHNLETHLFISDGTLLDAYNAYLNLPEVKKSRSEIKRPEWLKDIKCQGDFGWDGLWKGAKERILQRYLLLLRNDGYIIFPALADLDFTWGELPVEGEVRNLWGGLQKAEDLKKEIEKIKEMGRGKVKVGIYTWLWSDNPHSKPFKEHPEWYVIKSETGGDLIFFPGVNENYYRMASIDSSRQEMFERVYKMIKYYNLDIWYLDGGGAQEIIDWENMRLDDFYGWHKLYTDLRNTLQKEDPDKIVFFNHPENPLCDLGYFESFSGTLQKNWRPGAAWMWKFKLFQVKDPLHYPCFIYWTPSVEGYFEDYIVGTGTLPCFNSRVITQKDIAYVSAGWEIRPLELVEGNLSPNWRFDKETNIEGYTFKKNLSGIVFLKSHEESQIETKIGVDLKPLGITDKSKKVYSWLLYIKNAKKWDGRFGENELEEIYKKTNWVFDRVITPVFIGEDIWRERLEKNIRLNPEEGVLWIITQTPSFIYSIDNLPTQLWLPEVRDIFVSGEIQKDMIKLKVKSNKEKIEIGCFLPENVSVKEAHCGNEKVEVKTGIIGEKRFVVIPVVKGEWDIICHLKEEQGYKGEVEINYTKPELGKDMDIKIKLPSDWIGKPFIFQIEKEGKIYYLKNFISNNSDYKISVLIPEEMEKGVYNLIVSDITGLNRKILKIEFPGGKSKVYLPPPLLPLPVEKGIEKVNIKKEDIEIYSYGWEYSKGAGGFEFNPEKPEIRIFSLPMYESHWNSITGGIEMKVERYLKIKIKGNFNFFNKYQLVQKSGHSPRYGSPNYFIGFIIDFNTEKGYTKRTAAGLGIIRENRTSQVPTLWGTKKVPDEYYSLSDFALRKDIEEETMWIDLKQLGAPENWDGKIWLSPLMETICPDRKLSIEIIKTSSTLPEEKIKEGIILSEKEIKKNCKVPKITQSIKIDGKLEEKEWKSALKFDSFTLLHFPAIQASQKTEGYILYDDKFLYIGFFCEERGKEVLSLENSKVWDNDGIEFLFELYKENGFFHGIIDAGGRYYQEIQKDGEKKEINVCLFDFAVYKEKDFFSFEIKLPFSVLKIENPEGKKIGFNLMRNRYFKGEASYFTLVPGNSYFVLDRYFLEF